MLISNKVNLRFRIYLSLTIIWNSKMIATMQGKTIENGYHFQKSDAWYEKKEVYGVIKNGNFVSFIQ